MSFSHSQNTDMTACITTGIDRCGKTTQSGLLVEHLKTETSSAELIRFPNRESCIGKLINSYLSSESNMNDNTIHLLFSANRWEASVEIEEKLLSGTTLVRVLLYPFPFTFAYLYITSSKCNYT